MAIDDKKFCEKCKKTIAAKEFYKSNNLAKYPDGKLNQCRKCITMHVDNWDKDTYLPIMKECDVPYVPKQWYTLLERYGKDRSKVNGTTILGRYLSTMQMIQYKDYRWEDTEYLQELEDSKTKEAMKRQGYGAAEINEVIKSNRADMPTGTVASLEDIQKDLPQYTNDTPYVLDYSQPADDDFNDDLTDENKTYLRLKWGRTYRPEEWVRLEQLYEEMQNSYDIQGAGHEDILKLVCKTSLKANQLLDMGDVDGAQKMIKMYDGLMKSGKFTAAQNKAENGEFLDSISELVVICEKQGFIPRFYTDGPKDRVDETIQDLKEYTHSLVVEEMNLGNLIESAVKQMAIEEAKEEDSDDDDEDLTFDELDTLRDKDFEEFYDMVDDESDDDDDFIKSLIEGDI